MGAYQDIAKSIADTVDQKQAAYGDSFGKAGAIIRVLYPDGILPQKLDDALTVVRVVDKLFRIATSRDALGESPWRDIAGYSLLSVRRTEANAGPALGSTGVGQTNALNYQNAVERYVEPNPPEWHKTHPVNPADQQATDLPKVNYNHASTQIRPVDLARYK